MGKNIMGTTCCITHKERSQLRPRGSTEEGLTAFNKIGAQYRRHQSEHTKRSRLSKNTDGRSLEKRHTRWGRALTILPFFYLGGPPDRTSLLSVESRENEPPLWEDPPQEPTKRINGKN